MAFDAWDGYYVFFGGCSLSVCPNSETWVLQGGFWTNRTASLPLAPPARTGGSLTYDPDLPGLLLFGGCGRICPLNDTWEFSGGTWTNISADCVVPVACPPARWGAVLTYANSPWNNSAVLFGGCLTSGCATDTNGTWEFNLSAGGWWAHALRTGAAPSARHSSSMAFDPRGNFSFLFGGCNATTGGCSLNDTWEFANYTWTNLSRSYPALSLASPPARGSAAMIASGNDASLRLFGGRNTSTNVPANDSWQLACISVCYWTRISTNPTPEGRWWAAAPDWVPFGVDPVMFGGRAGPSLAQLTNTTWVYGPPLSVQSMIQPVVGEVTLPSTFSGVAGLGSGSYWYIWNLDPLTPGSATLTVRGGQAGTFPFTLVGADLITEMSGSVTIPYTWAPYVQATASSLPPSGDVGIPLQFVGNPAPGTGASPFFATWNFGDGSATVNGPTPTHAFTTVGTYHVAVNESDADGAWNVAHLTVAIHRLPSVSANASLPATDVGLPVSFMSAPIDGTAPFVYHWAFGDGTISGLQNASHVFTTAATFNVTVTVTDVAGAPSTAMVPVQVHAAPSANPTYSPTHPTAGASTNFLARAAGGTGQLRYSWIFGDGGASLFANPSHIFARPGNFTVELWVNDSVGGSVATLTSVLVTEGSSSNGGSGSHPAAVPSWVYLIAAIAAIAGIGGVVALVRRRRPPSSRGAPTAAEGTATTEDDPSSFD
ncbi:MAG: PKD domain-containing protein [Thermoplasmata archaeon]|nr:PKD domain-containing protein [Thermoplasmata archaeon]